MKKNSVIRLGTRGSPLALAQAELTVSAMKSAFPETQVEIRVIHTSGDKDRVRSLVSMAGSGVFVKELETALLTKEIDVAVHSLKDVPSQMDSRLHLAGFLKRENPLDVLVSRGNSFQELLPGAKVGTGSPRRILQLRKLRPDLNYVNIRGNLETRIRLVKESNLDAVILGAAGLCRLGMNSLITQTFSVNEMIPAIGQGIIALQCLCAHEKMSALLAEISDPRTTQAAYLERYWMNLLGGGCRTPMAAILSPEKDGFRFFAYLSDLSGKSDYKAEIIWSQNASEFDVEAFSKEFIRECRQRKVALPSEVEEHALLEFWK